MEQGKAFEILKALGLEIWSASWKE